MTDSTLIGLAQAYTLELQKLDNFDDGMMKAILNMEKLAASVPEEQFEKFMDIVKQTNPNAGETPKVVEYFKNLEEKNAKPQEFNFEERL